MRVARRKSVIIVSSQRFFLFPFSDLISDMLRKISTTPFHYTIVLCIMAWGLLLMSCSAEENQPPPSPVSPESVKPPVERQFRSISGLEAQSLIDQKEELLVLDVRTPQERSQVRISDSQLVPIGDVMRGRLAVPKEQPILVVCAVGGRSYVVGKALLAMGHQEVYNLEGGIEAWRRARLPVETGRESRQN